MDSIREVTSLNGFHMFLLLFYPLFCINSKTLSLNEKIEDFSYCFFYTSHRVDNKLSVFLLFGTWTTLVGIDDSWVCQLFYDRLLFRSNGSWEMENYCFIGHRYSLCIPTISFFLFSILCSVLHTLLCRTHLQNKEIIILINPTIWNQSYYLYSFSHPWLGRDIIHVTQYGCQYTWYLVFLDFTNPNFRNILVGNRDWEKKMG